VGHPLTGRSPSPSSQLPPPLPPALISEATPPVCVCVCVCVPVSVGCTSKFETHINMMRGDTHIHTHAAFVQTHTQLLRTVLLRGDTHTRSVCAAKALSCTSSIRRVGQNPIHTGVCMVFLAGKSLNKKSYTEYIYVTFGSKITK